MSYSFDSVVFKAPSCESSASVSDAVKDRLLTGRFDNYDKDKSLGKSRHLSAATRLLSSTALKLTENKAVADKVESSPRKVGVYIACENINLEDDFEFDLCAKNFGPDYVSPLKAPNTLANAVGSHFARFLGLKGPNCTLSSGRLGAFQALDIAMMHIDSGAVETAFVGAVEVDSPYHSRIDRTGRELAVASALRRSTSDDSVVFYSPLIRAAGSQTEETIARSAATLANKYLPHRGIDELWIGPGAGLDRKQVESSLEAEGLGSQVALFSKEDFDGECANGMLLVAMARESLQQESFEKGSELRSIAIAEVDESGQVSVLLGEGR